MLYSGGSVLSFVHNAFDYDGHNYCVVKMQCWRKNVFRNIVSKIFSAILIYTRYIYFKKNAGVFVVVELLFSPLCALLSLALYTLCRLGLLFLSYRVHNSGVLCHGSSNKLQSLIGTALPGWVETFSRTLIKISAVKTSGIIRVLWNKSRVPHDRICLLFCYGVTVVIMYHTLPLTDF